MLLWKLWQYILVHLFNECIWDHSQSEQACINCSCWLYLDQIIFTSVVDIMCEDDEGNGDDELTTEVISDEDEILRVCHTLKAM